MDIVAAKEGVLFLTLTTDAVILWHADTLLILYAIRRVTDSLESLGFNRRFFLREDAQLLVIQTTGNALLIYDICEDSDPDVRVFETEQFAGAPRIWLKHRQNIRVEAGIQTVCVTQTQLVISTRKPAMIQTMDWQSKNEQPETQSVMTSKLSFFPEHTDRKTATRLHEMIYLSSLRAFVWLSNFGDVFLVEYREGLWEGRLLREQTTDLSRVASIAFNDKQGVLCVSLLDGSIINHEISTSEKGLFSKVSKTLRSPNQGALRHTEWSKDGKTLLVVSSSSWSLISSQGFVVADCQDLTDQDHFRTATWLTSVHTIIFVPTLESKLLVTRYGESSGPVDVDEDHRALLWYRNRIALRKPEEVNNEEQKISPSIKWIHFPMTLRPAEASSVRFASFSGCGRYLATAGQHGLSKYSISDRKWTEITDVQEARSLHVECNPVWLRHLLIVAVKAIAHELRVFSRDDTFENALLIVPQKQAVVSLAIREEFVHVVQADHKLAIYQIVQNHGNLRMALRSVFIIPELVAGTDFALLYAASAVQILSLCKSTLLLANLSSGNGVVKIAHNIEWFKVLHGPGPLRNTLFAFDGQECMIWLNVIGQGELPQPSIKVSLDFYPIDVCLDSGMIHGLTLSQSANHDHISRRWVSSDVYKEFAASIIELLLRHDRLGDALIVAGRYSHLPTFSNFLELLLYRALEDALESTNSFLTIVWSFLQNYATLVPRVVVGCTRKSEMTSWSTLFAVVGDSIDLYNQCLSNNDYRTAAAYLLVINTQHQKLDHQRVCSRTSIANGSIRSACWKR